MKKIIFQSILFFIFFSLFIKTSISAELKVKLLNLDKSGTIYINIFDNEESYNEVFFLDNKNSNNIYLQRKINIDSKNNNEIYFYIPDGNYAVTLFIDENNNQKLDTNFIGIPKEKYGFSNNAKGIMSAPKFEKVKFELKEKVTQIIKLK